MSLYASTQLPLDLEKALCGALGQMQEQYVFLQEIYYVSSGPSKQASQANTPEKCFSLLFVDEIINEIVQ